MTYRIGKRYTFDAAHHLPGLFEGHKCARNHGHTYTVEVTLTSETLAGPGFVTDFGDLASFGAYIDAELDHRDLNAVLGFPPTSERLAKHLADWFMRYVEPEVHGRLLSVRVSETPSSWAEYLVSSKQAA